MIHTAETAKGPGNYQAGCFDIFWLTALSETVLQKWFSCILLAKQMTSEETGAKRGGSKNKCKFLLCEIGWPVLSASQSLLEIRFYLRYDHFSPTPPFMEQYCFPGATHLVTCGVLLKCVESSFWTNQSKIGQISLKVK